MTRKPRKRAGGELKEGGGRLRKKGGKQILALQRIFKRGGLAGEKRGNSKSQGIVS